ncbi:hypothetical protein COT94_03525 [Candidatus Falkowbacteria bacterium CG10_big_fil_rev_8_21_14_0_10_37_14]|uniref:Type II secretion system protein GspI C-terminal domain-containing protein n=1 Tax=Candidatus Falkowbacteria bacterium CG10_big_fil_rev_8_21_14_0_10_37_14 TaxID=1974561 RepID=A0A2M6WSV6_9BACT|nr:prepilin-type N-terminal cleavage/methylation domain-containing protein [Candidatus Falkowbacteria bacterium]PIT95890.1 MAG: hypothetical protein COT94_03525 [Candidatus Falkowbacteria bacterium CG10_big_fil_rev_8_21_14_0_10_37_14]
MIFNKSKGLSLLEIIIALAIFALVASSVGALWMTGNQASDRGALYERASVWAEEGLEGSRWIAWNNWDSLSVNQSGLDRQSNVWVLKGEGTYDNQGELSRRLFFTNVCRTILSGPIIDCPNGVNDPATRKVRVIISWSTPSGETATLERSLWLINHTSFE